MSIRAKVIKQLPSRFSFSSSNFNLSFVFPKEGGGRVSANKKRSIQINHEKKFLFLMKNFTIPLKERNTKKEKNKEVP